MDTLPLHDDLATLGFGCVGATTATACASDPILGSSRRIEYKYKGEWNQVPNKQHRASTPPPPRRPSRQLGPKVPSFRGLMSSFVKTSTSKNNSHHDRRDANEVEAVGCVSPSSPDQYFALEHERQGGGRRGKGFDELLLCSMPSLLDDSINNEASIEEDFSDEKQDVDVATTCPDDSESSEDSLALEVGRSAHEYLEQCFYTEVSVLDREKFQAIPEIVKSDLAIMGHLGKGSYSDVFQVVAKNGKLAVGMANNTKGTSQPDNQRRPSRARRASSITVATLSRSPRCDGNQCVLAMKCLRPQIRSDADQFIIGAEDLVHETAILANLDHPNIIKLYGRSPGKLMDAFVLNDGYFILLDKLDKTLQDRMSVWKRSPQCMLRGPTSNQIQVAQTVAEAVSYLHSKNIIFRDLKPENVGFDTNGVLKLFDFGFAAGLPEKDEMMNPHGLLYGRCGTPRYMAPEVALSEGYGLSADVHSFGILLWQICSLNKPFSHIMSADEFDRSVFIGHERPLVKDSWPTYLKEIMRSCWAVSPSERPTMQTVKCVLSSITTDVASHLAVKKLPAKKVVGASKMHSGHRSRSLII